MATKDGKDNGKKSTRKPVKASPLDNIPDIFGERAQDDVASYFADISPTALHSVISRICRAGGYIGFSTPTGGASVSISVTVGGSAGKRFAHNGQELSAFIGHLNNVLRTLEEAG
jgi:hypothetical protein